MQVQIADVISRYSRGNVQMAQVVIHHGKGSERRSETRHIKLSGKTWTGNNPDPTTVSRRDQAAKAVATASRNYEQVAEEIAQFEDLLARELTADEMAMFQRQGFSTEELAREAVQKTVIPTLKLRLMEAKMAHHSAKNHQTEVEEAYPLEVEFIGVLLVGI
jgi:hypothetical protein